MYEVDLKREVEEFARCSTGYPKIENSHPRNLSQVFKRINIFLFGDPQEKPNKTKPQFKKPILNSK